MSEETKKPKLYEEIASKVITLIEQGSLKRGEKIQSIREMSSQLGVSGNTIKESYWLLENLGYIEAVPQSGYYVRKDACISSECIGESDDNLNPGNVSLVRIYKALKEDGLTHDGAELGIASVSHDLWPSEKISKYYLEALRLHNYEANDYCMSPGYRPLRDQLAVYNIKLGLSLSGNDFVITCGCNESLYLALMTVCEKGDTIAVESPVYFNLLQLCEFLQLKVVEIPNSPEDGMHIETLEFAIENYPIKTVITIPSFNNPLGCCMKDEKKKMLVELLEKKNIPLIEDQVYSELAFDGNIPVACKSFDKTGNVILCSSFSKVLAPGIRVGWIVPGKFFREIETLKNHIDVGTAALPQMVIFKYLQEGGYERYLRNLRATLKERVENVQSRIIKLFPEGTEVNVPAGGFLLWVKMPSAVDSLELYRNLLKKKIIIAPGAMFSMTGKFNNYIRINAGIWNKKIEESICIISEEVRSLMKSS